MIPFCVTCILGSLTGTSSGKSRRQESEIICHLQKIKIKTSLKKCQKLSYFICFPAARWKVLNGSVRLGLCGDRRRRDALLLHPVGLGADDQAEKVLVRNGWSRVDGRWSGTPLIVQPGALQKGAKWVKHCYASSFPSCFAFLKSRNNRLSVFLHTGFCLMETPISAVLAWAHNESPAGNLKVQCVNTVRQCKIVANEEDNPYCSPCYYIHKYTDLHSQPDICTFPHCWINTVLLLTYCTVSVHLSIFIIEAKLYTLHLQQQLATLALSFSFRLTQLFYCHSLSWCSFRGRFSKCSCFHRQCSIVIFRS